MKNLPLVSVVISVKNETEKLRDCVDDLLCQTYENLQIIIVDDGSGKETKGIIEAFTDPRIVKITLPVSKGQAAARNEALQHVKGDFVAIADADDRFAPDRIELQADYMEIHPHVDILGSHFKANAGKKPWEIYEHHYEIFHQFLINNPMVHSTVFFRAELIQNGYHYRPAYNTAEDYDLFARMRNHWIFHNLSAPLVTYYIRERKSSSIEDQKEKARKVREKTLSEYFRKHTAEDTHFHHRFCELDPGLDYIKIERWIQKLIHTQPAHSIARKDLTRILYRQFWLYLRVCPAESSKKEKFTVLKKSKHGMYYLLKNSIKIMLGRTL